MDDEDNDNYVHISLDGSDFEVNSAESAVSANTLNTFQGNALVPTSVPIVSYETLESRSRITIFKLHVDSRYFIHRSYMDFCRLRDKLVQTFPGFCTPLPPKRWLRQFQHDFLEKRRLGLQTFLDQILGHAEMAQSPVVKEFLCLDGITDSVIENDIEQRCFSVEEELEFCHRVLAEKEEMVAELLRENELLQNQNASLMESSRLERQYFREKLEEMQHQLERCGQRNCSSLPSELERSGDVEPSSNSCARCSRRRTRSFNSLIPSRLPTS